MTGDPTPPLTEEELAEMKARDATVLEGMRLVVEGMRLANAYLVRHDYGKADVPRLIADLRAAREQGERAWDAGYDAGYKAAVDALGPS